ncbi:recombinase family protein [Sphingomonas sp. IC-11]|uniref:recombinase family protein n=1 Tax=Sphingomonas sp. IC-11 TaxID=2898528 RepID=UPI001E3C3BBB|nr:recombinase family protein [Sphingomonas sp. IC-11]MCD2316382.1 recombinase family protein [Sphingomonas sp. IC-11]
MANGKFVAYYRVSTEKQGRSGLGLDAQRKSVTDYLNGGAWDLTGEFVEVESGKVDQRPKLEQALSLCELTGATLVVAKLDRLSRNVAFLAALQDSGARFVAADMPEANELTIHIMAAVAQAERKAISRRTIEALAAAKARGVKLGGARRNVEDLRKGPAASATVRGKASEERAAKVLRHIEVVRTSGAESLREIAAGLNAAGITTPRGGVWQASQVKRILDARHPSPMRSAAVEPAASGKRVN